MLGPNKQYTSKEKADARHEDVITLFYQKQLEGSQNLNCDLIHEKLVTQSNWHSPTATSSRASKAITDTLLHLSE